jgi:hypothetical protein
MDRQDKGKDSRESPIRNLRQSDHFLTLSLNINVLSTSRVLQHKKKNVKLSEGCCLINGSEIIVTA